MMKFYCRLSGKMITSRISITSLISGSCVNLLFLLFSASFGRFLVFLVLRRGCFFICFFFISFSFFLPFPFFHYFISSSGLVLRGAPLGVLVFCRGCLLLFKWFPLVQSLWEIGVKFVDPVSFSLSSLVSCPAGVMFKWLYNKAVDSMFLEMFC